MPSSILTAYGSSPPPATPARPKTQKEIDEEGIYGGIRDQATGPGYAIADEGYGPGGKLGESGSTGPWDVSTGGPLGPQIADETGMPNGIGINPNINSMAYLVDQSQDKGAYTGTNGRTADASSPPPSSLSTVGNYDPRKGVPRYGGGDATATTLEEFTKQADVYRQYLLASGQGTQVTPGGAITNTYAVGGGYTPPPPKPVDILFPQYDPNLDPKGTGVDSNGNKSTKSPGQNSYNYGTGAPKGEVDNWDFKTGKPKDTPEARAYFGDRFDSLFNGSGKQYKGTGATDYANETDPTKSYLPGTNAGKGGYAYKTPTVLTLNDLTGTAANYYTPGQPGYNVYGNMPGFRYNTKSGDFEGYTKYGGTLGDGDVWVPWAVAPQALKDAYGNDSAKITRAPGSLSPGTLDKGKVENGDVVPLLPDGQVDIQSLKDKGFLGTGVTLTQFLNSVAGRALEKAFGKPYTESIYRLHNGWYDRPGGPLDPGDPLAGTGKPGDNSGEAGNGDGSYVPPGSNPGGGPGGPGTNPNDPNDPGVDPITGQPNTGKPPVTGPLVPKEPPYVPSAYENDPNNAPSSFDGIIDQYSSEYNRLKGGQGTRETSLEKMINGRTDNSAQTSRIQALLNNKQQGRQDTREQRILDALGSPTDFSSIRGELTSISQAVADELFGKGGSIDKATRGAMDDSVASGFGTTSGGYTAARQNILSGGRDVVGRSIAQNGAALAQLAVQQRGQNLDSLMGLFSTGGQLDLTARGQDIGAETDILRTLAPLQTQERLGELAAYQGYEESQSKRLDEMRDSIFNAQSATEQLKMAREAQSMNKQLIDKALKSGKTDWLGGIKDIVGLGAAGLSIYKLGKDLFS